MFEVDINKLIKMAIATNQMEVEDCDNYFRCFYCFGQEQIGAILIKQNGVIHGYRTRMIPNNEIFDAVIEHCKDHIDSIC